MNQNNLFKILKYLILTALGISFFLTFSCKKEDSHSFGVGPIQSKIELGALDNALAQKNEKCAACHKIKERYVGPAIKGVTKRRAPEWIMNMILAPVKAKMIILMQPKAKKMQKLFEMVEKYMFT
jgi:hypothetical protein